MTLQFNHKIMLALGILYLNLLGCADTSEIEETVVAHPQSYNNTYKYPYEEVWRAAQISLSTYPIRINDMDAGVLETDSLKVGQGWTSPHQKKNLAGRKYKIQMKLTKGTSKNEPAIMVKILKTIEVQKDFFANVETAGSDGLEESSLLYRIDRELTIDRAIKRAHKAATESK